MFWLQAHKGVNVESMLAKCLVGTLAPPSPATQRRNSQSIAKSKPELIVKSVMQTLSFYLSLPSPFPRTLLPRVTCSNPRNAHRPRYRERVHTKRRYAYTPIVVVEYCVPESPVTLIALQTASLTQTINGEASCASNEQLPQCLYCVTNNNAIFGCQHLLV